MGMVQQLVALVRTEHSPFHEHVLGALCSLVTDFPQGVRECREPELGLEELLRHRCQLLQQREEYQVHGEGTGCKEDQVRGEGMGFEDDQVPGEGTRSLAPCPCPIQEELEFCEKLLQTCFSSPTDDSMDR
ncbi:Hsp70-binding protein 1 [Saguinus oedipus]|uniref:Hsp70-binding protein 1 n=1 Tax=Saguinus oedipus TaxID=9490 RepID=A0ABQ9TXF8_SAGOE|nr:Hsp70-binding protein 1 [Saguinus oedipus]